MPEERPVSEWARGWPLVAAGAMGMAIANLQGGAMGLLMRPMTEEFGWTRAQISASALIICLGTLILGPFVGVVIERFGARRVALAGMVVFCAALGSVGFSGPDIATWYIAWTAVGLSFPMVSTVVWTLGVGRAFERQRGLAFALTISGVGVAGFISPLIAVALLPHIGWRGIYFAFSLGGLLVGWPVIWALFHPERIAIEQARASTGRPPVLTGYSLRQILGSIRFWSLALTGALLAAAVGGLSLHLQPIMRDAGLSAVQAAGYASLLGPASIAGHLLVGRLLDKFPARYVAATFFAAPAIVCGILLNYDGSPAPSLVAVGILGLSLGIEGDIIAYLTARYFGLKRYGVSFAILIGTFSLGWGLSPVIAGAVFDTLGSYDAMLEFLIGGLFISVTLVLLLGRPPEFRSAQPAPRSSHVNGPRPQSALPGRLD